MPAPHAFWALAHVAGIGARQHRRDEERGERGADRLHDGTAHRAGEQRVSRVCDRRGRRHWCDASAAGFC